MVNADKAYAIRDRDGDIVAEAGEGKGSLNRYKKDSFYYYQKVIQTNGESI